MFDWRAITTSDLAASGIHYSGNTTDWIFLMIIPVAIIVLYVINKVKGD